MMVGFMHICMEHIKGWPNTSENVCTSASQYSPVLTNGTMILFKRLAITSGVQETIEFL